MSGSNVLEPGGAAITIGPTNVLDKVDQFMLEDALQCLQTVCAQSSTSRNGTIVRAEAVEEQAACDGDFVRHFTCCPHEPCRFAARPAHARRKPETKLICGNGLPAETGKEKLVIGLEERLEILNMNGHEVCVFKVL
jgi:hypothetical protein